MKIAVIGGGYVGIVSGTCLAEIGHTVTIVEIDPEKVKAINGGKPPIYEAGLERLLQKNTGKRLRAECRYDSIAGADIIFICVGTPPGPDGCADLSFIRSAGTSIGAALRGSHSYCVIAVKSTVPPGTTENIVQPLVLKASGRSFQSIGFVMNPEFLREGRAVEDFMHPDRIVIGSSDERAGDVVAEAYRPVKAPVIRTGTTAAEMIKYASNAFLATKISFSNEIGNVCKRLGIDVYEVMEGVGLDPRIGPLFLNAGAGFGGSCFPKDVAALAALAKERGEEPLMLAATLAVNERQPHRMVALLEDKIGPVTGKRIAVLGLAFKDNTDDIRDSRAIPVIRELLEKGARIAAFDPMAQENMRRIFPSIEYPPSAAEALTGAEGCLVMTEWPEFSSLDEEFSLMAQKVIIEGRRILSCREREGICW